MRVRCFLRSSSQERRASDLAPRRAGPAAAAAGRPRAMYTAAVSPTVFKERGYRFYFFSREEARMHVHVHHADGEAKFWLEPAIELAQAHGLSAPQIAAALDLVRRHEDEIRTAWGRHFGTGS